MSAVANDGVRNSQNNSSSSSPLRLLLLPPFATEKQQQLMVANKNAKNDNQKVKALQIKKILPLDLKVLHSKKKTNKEGYEKRIMKAQQNNPYEAKFTKYSRISDLYSPINVQKSQSDKFNSKDILKETNQTPSRNQLQKQTYLSPDKWAPNGWSYKSQEQIENSPFKDQKMTIVEGMYSDFRTKKLRKNAPTQLVSTAKQGIEQLENSKYSTSPVSQCESSYRTQYQDRSQDTKIVSFKENILFRNLYSQREKQSDLPGLPMLIPAGSFMPSKQSLNSYLESRQYSTPRQVIKDVSTKNSDRYPYLNNQEVTYQQRQSKIMNLSSRSLSVPRRENHSEDRLNEKIVPSNELYTKLKLNLLTSQHLIDQIEKKRRTKKSSQSVLRTSVLKEFKPLDITKSLVLKERLSKMKFQPISKPLISPYF